MEIDFELVALRRARGESWASIADTYQLETRALEARVNRVNRRRGMTSRGSLLAASFRDLNLWSDTPTDLRRLAARGWLEIGDRARQDLSKRPNIPQYVIGRAPELPLLFMNEAATRLYRLPPATPILGWSAWQGMADPRIFSRITNLPEYHQKGVRVAKALLLMGERMGERQQQRVRDIVHPYREFVDANCFGLWDNTRPDLFALTSQWPKRMHHWALVPGPDDLRARGELRVGGRPEELSFTVTWRWRFEWEAFHAVYEPADFATERELNSVLSP